MNNLELLKTSKITKGMQINSGYILLNAPD